MTGAGGFFDPPPRRIAVLRALALGDLLCALPALRALRAAAPDATIALVGLPWAREFVDRYRDCLDEFVEFPGHPAFPERAVDEAARAGFGEHMRALGFDMALQLHGSGQIANDIVAGFGAGRIGGFHPRDEAAPGPGFMPWPETGHEIDRLRALPLFLGAPDGGRELHFPITARDRAEAASLGSPALARAMAQSPRGLLPADGPSTDELAADAPSMPAGPPATRGLICIHPGARLPSRRWPAVRFADVAAGLIADGWTVAVTGSAGEVDIAADVIALARARLAANARHDGRAAAPSLFAEDADAALLNLCGQTSLGALAAVLDRAALLVCNDTGLSHVAAALRLPSIVIASGSEVARWAPLDAALHRVLATDIDCRPCAYEICPIGHPCALAISADEVLAVARAALDTHLHHAEILDA